MQHHLDLNDKQLCHLCLLLLSVQRSVSSNAQFPWVISFFISLLKPAYYLFQEETKTHWQNHHDINSKSTTWRCITSLIFFSNSDILLTASEPQENQNALQDTNTDSCMTHKCHCCPLEGGITGQGGHGTAHTSWGFLHCDIVSNRCL